MTDPGPFRTQEQGGAGGSHAGEFLILLAAAVDAGVGFLEGLAQRRTGTFAGIFVIGMGDDAGGQLAGQLADSVAAHTVSHHEDMTTLPPLPAIRMDPSGETPGGGGGEGGGGEGGLDPVRSQPIASITVKSEALTRLATPEAAKAS